tara:strand:- start:24 stop:1700 length:1677 start_codon:yes stop_codon:yes gene_type:complete
MPESYVSGISSEPLIGMTIGKQLDKTVNKYPDHLAIISKKQNIKLTWAQFSDMVNVFAAGLIGLGLKPGERIGIWSPNNVEWAVVQFSAAKAGLILVNINPAYRLSELKYALNKVDCSALVIADKFKSTSYIEILYELAPELEKSKVGNLKCSSLPSLKTVIRLGNGKFPGVLNYAEVSDYATPVSYSELEKLSSKLQFDDSINIQFTSGTTGYPKGATLTHHGILNNAYFNGQALRLTENDRVCIPVPLYHCFGMVMGNLMCASYGACMVYPGQGFDALDVLKVIEDEKCSILYGVPTMFIAILDHPAFKNYDLESLRSGTMAGSPCPIEVMKRVINHMHMKDVTIAYGMTETSPVSFQSSHNDSVERRVSTVGQVHPHVEVKVIDEYGKIVKRGDSGELLTRGYSVMQGYWNDDEKTREVIDKNGWMHTGDMASIDSEGYGRIVGRIKDLVIRGGENIYPREIEDFLFSFDKIQDVQVIGVPDKKYGEELCAWVKLHQGKKTSSTEIQNFCKGKIAHYKIPKYFEFVDSFPMTVTGKIQKFKMREQMIEKLKLSKI